MLTINFYSGGRFRSNRGDTYVIGKIIDCPNGTNETPDKNNLYASPWSWNFNISCTPEGENFNSNVTGAENNNTAILVGSGNEPEDFYNVGMSDIIYTVTSSSLDTLQSLSMVAKFVTDGEYEFFDYTITLYNGTPNDYTIKEIGLGGILGDSRRFPDGETYFNYTDPSTNKSNFVIAREVLSSPVTIHPQETIPITLRIPCTDGYDPSGYVPKWVERLSNQ